MIPLITGRDAPILLKMKGKVSNMRPGPELGSKPAAKTAGINNENELLEIIKTVKEN